MLCSYTHSHTQGECAPIYINNVFQGYMYRDFPSFTSKGDAPGQQGARGWRLHWVKVRHTHTHTHTLGLYQHTVHTLTIHRCSSLYGLWRQTFITLYARIMCKVVYPYVRAVLVCFFMCLFIYLFICFIIYSYIYFGDILSVRQEIIHHFDYCAEVFSLLLCCRWR